MGPAPTPVAGVPPGNDHVIDPEEAEEYSVVIGELHELVIVEL